MNKRLKIFLILSILIFAIAANMDSAKSRGLGVGPNVIEIDSALRNSTYEQPLFIFNQNDFDTNILLNSTGETQSWVTFHDYNNREKPINEIFLKNMTDKPVWVKIQIPPDAENKAYRGILKATAKPEETGNINGSHSSVDLSIPVILMLNVTGDEKVNVSVGFIEIEAYEINDPAKFHVQFKNTGNVRVEPEIEILITKDDMYIDRLTGQTEYIRAPSIVEGVIQHTHSMTWNTTGKISGEYNAYFNITNNGETIKEYNETFELLPPGTLNRDGVLKEIKYVGEPTLGKLLKIISIFKNTGDIDTNAEFFGEIYLNGELIGTINSHNIMVEKYKEVTFQTYYKIEEKGEYKIVGYVLYGNGLETDVVILDFTAGLETGQLSQIQILIIIIFLFSISIIASYLIKRKKKTSFGFEKGKTAKEKTKQKKTKKEKPIKTKSKEKKIKVKAEKTKSIDIGKMSAKEIEDYVKGL